MSYLWTSESVSCGHPDKVADQIADAVLDRYLKHDSASRVAVEVVVTTCDNVPTVFLTGEVTSGFAPDSVNTAVLDTLQEIGYTDPIAKFWPVKIINHIRRQSPEIAKAVVKKNGNLGAGDQGIMFGYATDETPTYMPLTHHLALQLTHFLEEYRRDSNVFLPDAKAQVTLRCNEYGNPESVDTILISQSHIDTYDFNDLQSLVEDEIISKFGELEYYYWTPVDALTEYGERIACRVKELFSKSTKNLINPAGPWSIGGPAADTGLSGRKIVVDNYGPDCPIGGGSFSGKDPTKVDRTGAYAARYIAKNIVAAGLARKAQVQLSYAIGISEPISVRVQTFGTENASILLMEGKKAEEELTRRVREAMPLAPKAIIERLGLRNPIYRATASGGHFGRDIFPWEKLGLKEQLK